MKCYERCPFYCKLKTYSKCFSNPALKGEETQIGEECLHPEEFILPFQTPSNLEQLAQTTPSSQILEK